MCGVIGYWSAVPTAADRTTVRRLFLESKIRGLHAFGFATLNNLAARTLDLPNLLKILRQADYLGLIGHTRYSTSGDWRVEANNQPIVLDGMSLCFNGVISMKLKAEYEQEYGRLYQTENDGEIFMRHVLDGGDPVAFTQQMTGSFAGCYIRQGEVFALRNDRRPLWYAVRGDAVFVGSTRDILSRAGLAEGTELPAHVEYRLSDLIAVRPGAAVSQQAGRLCGLPHGYGGHWRYGPKLSGAAVSRQPV